MTSTNDVQSASTAEGRHALHAVLSSATFSKNPRLSSLLEYLCQRCFQGETGSIKEYSIATDVFGRPADFDQSTDAIVRVEMHRLRRKLKDFYANEGSDQPIEIVIHSGHYLPEFVVRQRNEASEREEREAISAAKVAAVRPKRPHTSRFKMWAVTGTAAFVVLVFIGWVAAGRLKSKPGVTIAASMGTPVSAVPSGDAVRILCGGTRSQYRDRQGNEWGEDAFATGGSAAESTAQWIYRTRNPQLFHSMRTGEFSYNIPLKPGVYELRLFFADTAYTPGPAMEGGENVRMFNVSLNGKVILRNFDIVADAGPTTADIRVFKDVSPAADGYLHLAWSHVADMPLVNAIEIVPGIRGHLRPIRLVTQDNMFTDRSGVVWSPDDYFLGGRTIARYGTVAGPEDPQLYERERYGNFSYAIPVAEGRYAVKLYFAETYFGPVGGGGGGVGSRLFDVYCNGTALLRRFDMFEEAGAQHQIIKTFHGLTPNAQGKLLLSFVPLVNYANLSAIEVLDEGE